MLVEEIVNIGLVYVDFAANLGEGYEALRHNARGNGGRAAEQGRSGDSPIR